jgi:hypothetical protein
MIIKQERILFRAIFLSKKQTNKNRKKDKKTKRKKESNFISDN